MGAWGTEPWENDSAGDFCYKLGKMPITTWIEEGLNSDYEEQRIAAFVLSQIGRNFIYPFDLREKHLNWAIKNLKTIRGDQVWIDLWKNKREIKAKLDAEIKNLESL